MNTFNGLGLGLGNLPMLSKAKTRSISAENPTGEKYSESTNFWHSADGRFLLLV